MAASPRVSKDREVISIQEMMREQARLSEENESLKRENLLLQKRIVQDPLTGLLNRSFLKQFVEEMKEGGLALPINTTLPKSEPQAKPGLLIIALDIDKFKAINDQYGHHVGDQVLKIFAEKLSGLIRHDLEILDSLDQRTSQFIEHRQSDKIDNSPDIAVRMGGEEFLLLMPMYHCNKKIIEMIAQRIMNDLFGEYSILNNQVIVTASVGMEFVAWDKLDLASEWTQNADRASYFAKNDGRRASVWAKDPNVNRYVQIASYKGPVSEAVRASRSNPDSPASLKAA